MSALTRCERAIVTGQVLRVGRAGRRDEPGEDVLEERAAGALHRAAADLLVVVGDEQLRVRGRARRRAARAWRCGRSRGCPAAARRPTSRRRRWRRTAGVSASTRSWPSTSAASTPATRGERARAASRRGRCRAPQTGTSWRLRVELQPVAHAAVEVDRQRRQPHRPARQHDQAQVDRAVGAATASRPGDGELAVEPGVGEQPAVRLDAHQAVVGRARRRSAGGP